MVRAQPFADTPPRRYVWAEYLRQEMAARISDVAHRLAEICIAADDPTGALLAVDRGLAASPSSESLYRLAFRAADRKGGQDAVEEYAAAFDLVLDDLHTEMQDETTRLLRALIDRGNRPTLRSA
jgi:CheY-like chemotaxis protein